MKNKKPSDLNLKITDRDFLNNDGTLKKKNHFERNLSNDLKIRYAYRIFHSEYAKTQKLDHQVFIGFMRGYDTLAAITSHISGDTEILTTTYNHDGMIWSKEKFLEKIESEPLIFEWYLWNI